MYLHVAIAAFTNSLPSVSRTSASMHSLLVTPGSSMICLLSLVIQLKNCWNRCKTFKRWTTTSFGPKKSTSFITFQTCTCLFDFHSVSPSRQLAARHGYRSIINHKPNADHTASSCRKIADYIQKPSPIGLRLIGDHICTAMVSEVACYTTAYLFVLFKFALKTLWKHR